MKNHHFLLFGFILFFTACKVEQHPYETLQGKTMGTYYKISYQASGEISKQNLSSAIDSILFVINDEMSTYIDSSFISEFNKSSSLSQKVPRHFKTVFKKSKEVFEISDGRFDPTVMPLANFWGFGYTGKVAREQRDSSEVKSIVEYVGLNKIKLENDNLIKSNVKAQLDFSAIAKGFASDVISSYLESVNINNYLIDIGGDGFAKGKNTKGKYWSFGINTPDPNSTYNDIYVALEINGIGIATSGNYRNYYEVDGELYGHTINAATGFPYKSNVLSASIIAPTAMEADAFATASMASSLSDALEMVEKVPNIEAYLIYSDDEGNMKQKYTSGFKDYILE